MMMKVSANDSNLS